MKKVEDTSFFLHSDFVGHGKMRCVTDCVIVRKEYNINIKEENVKRGSCMSKMVNLGGSDGPTSIFLAGSTGGMDWFSIFGLIFLVGILVPNIFYAFRFRNQKNKCHNKVMNLLEQIGRYSCMFFMVFQVGFHKIGFASVDAFLIYTAGNMILILCYWIGWFLLFRRQTGFRRMALAVIPTCIFLLCGITLRHVFLIISGTVFGIAHIYVTKKNC